MDIVHLPLLPGTSPQFVDTICLGNFDGFHRGHQQLVIDATLKSEGRCGVLLFDRNPADFINNGKSKRVISSLEDKIRILEKLRIDVLYVVHVDKAFFELSADDFIERYLLPIHVKQVFVGKDFRFGKGAKGTPEVLKKYFEVEVESLAADKNEKISTRRIITLLEEGKIEEANELLGRNYEITGKVVHGLHNGTKLGFPTANMELSVPYVVPKNGVYEGLVFVNGLPHRALVNVGINPTIGVLKNATVEVYIDNFSGDVYGKTLYLDFLERIRDEITFTSLDELKNQLQKDKMWLDNKYQK